MKVLVTEKLSEHKYKTPEGYLICVDSVLARTGKQTYKKNEIFVDSEDDTEIEIDRTPEEVFSDKTLASFENKPITVEHPDEDVNSENYKEYSVGFVRDVHKGEYEGEPVILGTLVITDAKTIEEIEDGQHVELSCGYDCDIADEENPCQRNIRGNHVALCEAGRAGIAKIVDSVKDYRMPSTTRQQFTRHDISEEKDIEWGTPKGNAYLYWDNDEIVFEGTGYYDNPGTKRFKSLNALNKWLYTRDSVEDMKDKFLSEEAKKLKEDLGLYKKYNGPYNKTGKITGPNIRPWNAEVTEAMNEALQLIIDGRNYDDAVYRLKNCINRYESLVDSLEDVDRRRMKDVISRGKRILEKLKQHVGDSTMVKDFYGEEEGFFTREDLMEFEDELERKLGHKARTRAYIDGNKLSVDYELDGESYSRPAEVKIDMRKIRNPAKDLARYYVEPIKQIIMKEAYLSDSEVKDYSPSDIKIGKIFEHRKKGKFKIINKGKELNQYIIQYDDGKKYYASSIDLAEDLNGGIIKMIDSEVKDALPSKGQKVKLDNGEIVEVYTVYRNGIDYIGKYGRVFVENGKYEIVDSIKDEVTIGKKYKNDYGTIAKIDSFTNDGRVNVSFSTGEVNTMKKEDCERILKENGYKLIDSVKDGSTTSIKNLSGAAWTDAMKYFCKLYHLDTAEILSNARKSEELEDKIDRAGYKVDFNGRIFRENKLIYQDSEVKDADTVIEEYKGYKIVIPQKFHDDPDMAEYAILKNGTIVGGGESVKECEKKIDEGHVHDSRVKDSTYVIYKELDADDRSDMRRLYKLTIERVGRGKTVVSGKKENIEEMLEENGYKGEYITDSVKDSDPHEIVVIAENYLSSLGKNNSTGKYDKIVVGVKSLFENGYLQGESLKEAVKREVDRLLKKYTLDSEVKDSYRGMKISWDDKAIYGQIISENDPLTNKTTIEEMGTGRILRVPTKLLEGAIARGEAKVHDSRRNITRVINAIRATKGSKYMKDTIKDGWINVRGTTSQGYEVHAIYNGKSGRLYAVIYRPRTNDYLVAAGYNQQRGDWDQGYYDFKSEEDARKFAEKHARQMGDSKTK